MPYWGIDSDRYGGWSPEEKEEALEHAELPPDREPCETGTIQTDIRRWLSSIDQARRMFGHHREGEVPEEPSKQLPDAGSDEELEADLEELEEELDEGSLF